MSIKQQMIKTLKHSIEKTEADIIEYSQPCEKSVAQNRTAHREYLKKQLKKMKKQLKELEE
ncbi:hypothetical protein [Streptococcus mitis]|uniref:hypothetical protein n=1 Tax=Streptococcus mitis TaxID=28037 RepID=UPI00115BC6E1|nr:hypothetical protein [Streptococcus mitis]